MNKLVVITGIISGILSLSLKAQNVSEASTENYKTSITASGLNQPWANEFLPNGDILVTEREGLIKIVREGEILSSSVANVPEVYFAGQGGLLDIMLDSNFADNRRLYLSYAYGSPKANATRLVSATLNRNKSGYQLDDIEIIFTASPLKSGPQHYSGRIAQMPDNTLLLTIGDGFDYREQSQKLDNHLGKIVRINHDGSPPSDNPFVGRAGAKPEIWSYGHRNHQSLVIENGVVYQNEHGPKGGDEVNIIKPGLNYGWPVITRGRDYNGALVTPYTEYPGMEQPLVDWTPSIAPSSMAFFGGRLYVTALAEQSIRALSIKGSAITDEGIVFSSIKGRIRDVSVSPNGELYVLTDGNDAQLIKITQTISR